MLDTNTSQSALVYITIFTDFLTSFHLQSSARNVAEKSASLKKDQMWRSDLSQTFLCLFLWKPSMSCMFERFLILQQKTWVTIFEEHPVMLSELSLRLRKTIHSYRSPPDLGEAILTCTSWKSQALTANFSNWTSTTFAFAYAAPAFAQAVVAAWRWIFVLQELKPGCAGRFV